MAKAPSPTDIAGLLEKLKVRWEDNYLPAASKISAWVRQRKDAIAALAAQASEIERLREALKFYADEAHWDDDGACGHRDWAGYVLDEGSVARSALAGPHQTKE